MKTSLICITIILLFGCTTVPATTGGDDYPKHGFPAVFTYEVEVIDYVTIKTKSGGLFEFEVTEITKHLLVGDNKEVYFEDISEMEIKANVVESIAFNSVNFFVATTAVILFVFSGIADL